MTGYKRWCWEAAAHGPDWLFLAQVSPASEGALDQLAAAAALPGYSVVGGEPAYCEQHQGMCQQRELIDAASAQGYADNLRGEAPRNLWIYNLVQVHRGRILIECGYGGRGEAHNEAETALLLDLLASPGITLQSWSVMAGGDGYDYTTLREGEGLDQLKAYLV